LLIREVTGAVYHRGKWRGLDRLSPIKLLLAERHGPTAPRRRTVRTADCGEPDADALDSAGAAGVPRLPPCLVVHGDRDPICPLGQAQQLTSVWALSAPCTLAVVPFGFHGLTSVLASLGSMAKYLGVAGRGESLAGCCVAFLERRVGANVVEFSGGDEKDNDKFRDSDDCCDGGKHLEGNCEGGARTLSRRSCAYGNVPTVDAATVVAAVDCSMLIVVASAIALSWP
jgi:hypothetical protein